MCKDQSHEVPAAQWGQGENPLYRCVVEFTCVCKRVCECAKIRAMRSLLRSGNIIFFTGVLLCIPVCVSVCV